MLARSQTRLFFDESALRLVGRPPAGASAGWYATGLAVPLSAQGQSPGASASELASSLLMAADEPGAPAVPERVTNLLADHGWHNVTIIVLLLILVTALLSLAWQRRQRLRADAETVRQRTALAHVARLGSIGELTASIVHEINQPLGAILANADAATMMLDDSNARHRELKAILHDIREDNLRASQIIQKLRTLLSKRTLESAPLSLNEVVEASRSLLGNLAIRHHVSLQMRLAADLPVIMGDATHLQQVLINLAANGMEAMGSLAPLRRILAVVTAVDYSGHALLIVTDRGPGIGADILPHVFESFYTTKPEGMGMGLAIVRTIVEAHRGNISVASCSHEGTVFKISFPPMHTSAIAGK